ncbi:MAG: MFS transporter [Actinomycetota bacterium]|nr:MFS transporter [Actinomycetota bacterium]
MSVGTLVRRSGFRNLLVGQGVSALGDWMGTVAFMALTLSITGSPAAVGGILALRLFPAAIGGPLAARAAGKWDRRRTMLAMDATRAAMIAVVPLVRGLWWIYLWAFLVEVASLVFLPARDSSIPDLVDRDDLPVANGLILGSSYGSIPLGAAAFAAVAALPGADLAGRPHALVFWIDALSFLVSFALIARITGLSGAGTTAAPGEKVSFRAAFRIPLVRTVMPAAAAVALGLGALFSVGIVFVREVLGASDAEFGWLIALFGAGAVIGIVVLQRNSGGDPILRTAVGTLGIGLIVAVFSLSPALWVAYLGAVGFGAAASYTLASGMGALQSQLDGQERVLAFTAFHVVIRSALALAAVGAGLAAAALGAVRWPLIGRLEPSRVVLLCSGALVVISATLVRERRRSPSPALAEAASEAASEAPSAARRPAP